MKKSPPSSLFTEPDFELKCDRSTKQFTLTLNDGTSFRLGSYWERYKCHVRNEPMKDGLTDTRVEEGVVTYLTRALGGRQHVAEDAVNNAFSMGFALVDTQSGHSIPIEQSSFEQRESQALAKSMQTAEKDQDELGLGINVVIERDISRGMKKNKSTLSSSRSLVK